MFSTREYSFLGFCLFILIMGICLCKDRKKVLSIFPYFIKIIFTHKNVLFVLTIFATYLYLVCSILKNYIYKNWDFIPIIVFSLLNLISIAFSSIDQERKVFEAKKIFNIQVFSTTLLFAFADLSSFNWIWETILWGIIIFSSFVLAVTQNQKNNKNMSIVGNFFALVLISIFLIKLIYSFSNIDNTFVENLGINLFTMGLSFLLSLAFIPLSAVIHFIVFIDNIRCRMIPLDSKMPLYLRLYILFYILYYYKFNENRIKKIIKYNLFCCQNCKTIAEIKESIKTAKKDYF